MMDYSINSISYILQLYQIDFNYSFNLISLYCNQSTCIKFISIYKYKSEKVGMVNGDPNGVSSSLRDPLGQPRFLLSAWLL